MPQLLEFVTAIPNNNKRYLVLRTVENSNTPITYIYGRTNTIRNYTNRVARAAKIVKQGLDSKQLGNHNP